MSVCEQAIKYSGTLSKEDREEDEQGITSSAIIVNPATKLVSVIVQDSVRLFDMEIVTINCNFNKNLSEGEAIYQGFIIQKDGSRTPSTIKLKAIDGALKVERRFEVRVEASCDSVSNC